MPYDGLVMAAVCHELSKKLIDGRIEKIYQPLKEEILISISKPRERFKLLASSNAAVSRIHTVEKTKPNPQNPPTFCMVLRKHLENGKIKNIRQQGLDRILNIDIDIRNDLGEQITKTLIIEVMGKHSNIILTQKLNDQSYKIIDAVKRYSNSVNSYREVLPGKLYMPPPPHNKVNFLHLSRESFIKLMLSQDISLKLTDVLQKILVGFSPLMCREIVYRSNLPIDILLDHCGEYELHSIWNQLEKMALDFKQRSFHPTLVLDKDNDNILEFSAFELTQFEKHKLLTGTMNHLLEFFYEQKYIQNQMHSKSNSLLTIVNQNINKLKSKIKKHNQSLKSAEKKDTWRIYGELLTANMHLLKKGMKKVELKNFYSDEPEIINVNLDPQLTPSENAQAYFKKYNKAKKTIDKVKEQLEQAKNELIYLENIENYIKIAKDLESLEEIKAELEEQGYVKQTKKTQSKTDKTNMMNAILKYNIDDVLVLVGKNNRQNEYLTHRFAKPDDIWLHTKEMPGSHVIIKTAAREVDDVVIKKAAQLAAYYSKARSSNNVPVDYTYIKHVRKPKGAKPGFVIYENQKTIFVKPDDCRSHVVKS